MAAAYAEVIGDPVGHSKSPLIHNFWLNKLGMDGDFTVCRVASGEIGPYLESRLSDPDWRGCSVTMPHKGAALAAASDREPAAEIIGSANCLLPREGRLLAFNTDTHGIIEALSAAGLAKRPVVLLGNGAAARTVLAVLRTQGLERIGIIARDEEKAERLASSFGLELVSPFEVDSEGGTARLLINATPLGMTGFEPIPDSLLAFVDLLRPDAMVFDMVYSPLETRLLSRARGRGLVAVSGLQMLIGQAESAFRFFFGADPPREHDEELRVLLSQ